MKTIRVTGKGQLKVKPDTTRISLTLEEVCRDYEEALQHSSEKTEGLRKLLSGFGFPKTDLKTFGKGSGNKGRVKKLRAAS